MKWLSNGIAIFCLSASIACAQEQAMVVSSTPVVQIGSDQQSRIAHYNVVYEYAGKRYSVQMPSDPGSFVTVQVTPVAAGALPMPPTEMPPKPTP